MKTSVITELYRVPNSLSARSAFVRQGTGAFHNMTGHWSMSATLLMDEQTEDFIMIVTKSATRSLSEATPQEQKLVFQYDSLIEELKHALDARKI